jgi:hypothetical protein
MPFEHDVFISYPHLSNQKDASGQNGWVAKFHNRMKACLSDVLGREARIWRDNKLPIGAVFGDEIRDRLRKSKSLICILSPAYINSEWCLRELKEFHSFGSQQCNLTVQNQSRIITVIKNHIPPKQHPDNLRESLYCKFYNEEEDDGGLPRELGQESGEYGHEEYKHRMDKVVWSVKQIIEGLGDDPDADIERTIYLAETTRDRADDRNRIRDELEARKFRILPDRALPTDDAQEYIMSARDYLKRAFMSIHLVGRTYGTVPDGEKRSVVHLQNELAAERSKDEQFKRLIWIAPNMENLEDNQSGFLNYLRTNEEMQRGAELNERSFEVIKTRIIQLITRPQSKPVPDNLLRVYVMCDKPDADSVDPVWRYLYDKGFEVIPPAEEDEEGQVIQYHKESLLLCDATLIMYGKTKWNWVQLRLNDVSERVKGWGRSRDISCKAILRTDPETDYKSRLYIRTAKLLPPCYNGISDQALESSLEEFINDLERALAT